MKFEEKKWKIYLKNCDANEMIFVCSFYDERLAQVKLNDLNKTLIDIIKSSLNDQE